MFAFKKKYTHKEMLKKARSDKPYFYSVYVGDSHPYDKDVEVSCVFLRKVEGISINLDTEEWEFMIKEYSNDTEQLYETLEEARDVVKKWAKWWQYNDEGAVIGWNKTKEEMDAQHKKLEQNVKAKKVMEAH